MPDNNKSIQLETALNITPSAIREIKRLMNKEKEQNLFLRVGVTAGGCSGMSYSMAFDTERLESDRSYKFDNVMVIVDIKALDYLKGMVLDYKGGLLGGGFIFDNPNAKRSCGCGTSFSC